MARLDLDALRRSAARELGVAFSAPATAAVDIDSTSPLCDVLELLVPGVLAKRHPEWQVESLDGFLFAVAGRLDSDTVELVGTAILISDQTMTPVALELRRTPDESVRFQRLRLGEPGDGPLGISGPKWGTKDADRLLWGLDLRLDSVSWVYELRE